MADFYLAQHDRSPSVKATLFHLDRKTPLDLTGATVAMRMLRAGGDGTVFGGACTVADDPTTGVVQYDWQTTDTATAGAYRAEFVVTQDDQRVRTWPEGFYVRVSIKPRLS